MTESVGAEDLTLRESVGGYSILVDGEHIGMIEGVPGHMEYIELELHWEGKGAGRAAVQEFVRLSRRAGESEVRTNNATSEAIGHILETEGFEERDDGSGWTKKLS